MSNFSTVLKNEISRLSKRHVRADTLKLKMAATQHRVGIAALKRRVLALERQVGRLVKAGTKTSLPISAGDGTRALRFSASRLAAHRQRLGLAAPAFGKLLGVSDQTVYKWENGKTRPRADHLQAFAVVRKMGKEQARARLEQLGG